MGNKCFGGGGGGGGGDRSEGYRMGTAGGSNDTVLFFPDAKLPCRRYKTQRGCNRNPCDFAHEDTTLTAFLAALSQATKSIDICVFTITCDDISNVVLDLHKKGVKVRVLTDNDQQASLGSDIGKFREAGIPTRTDNSPAHMHHKFAVIDGSILVNGSFNWTRQAVLANRENVVISHSTTLAQTFTKEFNKMWAMYK